MGYEGYASWPDPAGRAAGAYDADEDEGEPVRDILTLRDEARAARLAERVIPAVVGSWLDALTAQVEADIVTARLAVYAGPRCACGDLLTIADRGGKCRHCRYGGH